MSGDWIKMRTSLLTNPKVNGIARSLEDDKRVSTSLSTGYRGVMSEIVTRCVMRHVTVSSLLVVWGAANEHTKDGVFHNADISDIDDMVGYEGFGDAMASVGWLIFNEDECTLTLPNFSEYNTSGADRSAKGKTGAERQREYRERKKQEKSVMKSDVTHNVTSDITSNRREDKIREDNKDIQKKPKSTKTFIPNDFKVSERVEAWAKEKGFANLDLHLENFISACKAKGYQYVDFDEALMSAIRNNWAKVEARNTATSQAALVDIRWRGAK